MRPENPREAIIPTGKFRFIKPHTAIAPITTATKTNSRARIIPWASSLFFLFIFSLLSSFLERKISLKNSSLPVDSNNSEKQKIERKNTLKYLWKEPEFPSFYCEVYYSCNLTKKQKDLRPSSIALPFQCARLTDFSSFKYNFILIYIISGGILFKEKELFIYYSFFRDASLPVTSLGGKTPSEEAGIILEGDNKWLTLMHNAVQYQKSKVKQ